MMNGKPAATIHDLDERERAGRVASPVTQILMDADPDGRRS
jgi:hypothetical protein